MFIDYVQVLEAKPIGGQTALMSCHKDLITNDLVPFFRQ